MDDNAAWCTEFWDLASEHFQDDLHSGPDASDLVDWYEMGLSPMMALATYFGY